MEGKQALLERTSGCGGGSGDAQLAREVGVTRIGRSELGEATGGDFLFDGEVEMRGELGRSVADDDGAEDIAAAGDDELDHAHSLARRARHVVLGVAGA